MTGKVTTFIFQIVIIRMSGKLNAFLLSGLLTLTSIRSTSQVVDSTSFKLNSRLSFYSYEKSAELLLRTPGNMLNNFIILRLNSENKLLIEWQGRVAKDILRLPLDLSSIPTSTKIEAEIFMSKEKISEGGKKYLTRCDLIILPPKSNEVKTDRLTGGLIVNRRQFFPFGFYCYSPVYPTLPEEEIVKGFNMIAPYQKIVPEAFKERQAYMNRCAELGMKVHYNLLSVSGGGGVGSKMDGYTDSQKRDLLIGEIKAFMDHPALMAWYISDEPTGNKVTPETLEEIYKVVKETDPWHPVSIVFMAPFLSSRKFSHAVDIVMADPYPIPDLPASMVGDVAGKLEKEFNGEKPVWIVPQAFGGGELWSREPSVQEIRSMTYQSIINGATGIQYFVRHGLNAFPKSVSTWNECGRMALEVAEMTPWLLSDEQTNHAESSSKNIAVTTKFHNGQLLILAVNKINEPIRDEIRIEGIGNAKAKVIFENRNIAVNLGVISDLLPAYGSQAYMIDVKKNDEDIVPWSGNMIRDQGFEDISSTGIPSACYARTGKDRGATYFIDSREHIEGNHSLRIVTPQDSNGINLRFFPVTLISGKSYLVSIWAKADPEQKVDQKESLKTDEKGKNLKTPQYVEISLGEFGKARFVPKAEWHQFVTSVTIPSDTTSQVKSNVILNMPGQGVAWFDMLQLIEDPLQEDKSRK
jgi:hypothetical protein